MPTPQDFYYYDLYLIAMKSAAFDFSKITRVSSESRKADPKSLVGYGLRLTHPTYTNN
jgi:hypothetical protein